MADSNEDPMLWAWQMIQRGVIEKEVLVREGFIGNYKLFLHKMVEQGYLDPEKTITAPNALQQLKNRAAYKFPGIAFATKDKSLWRAKQRGQTRAATGSCNTQTKWSITTRDKSQSRLACTQPRDSHGRFLKKSAKKDHKKEPIRSPRRRDAQSRFSKESAKKKK